MATQAQLDWTLFVALVFIAAWSLAVLCFWGSQGGEVSHDYHLIAQVRHVALS